jgi:division protein CdvB (Snf7/Vps24/ESCRT-III family)
MKLGIKDYFIIILGAAVIIAFMLGQRRTIDYREGELQKLHQANEALQANNDSLAKVNKDLDNQIAKIHTEIAVKEAELRQSNKEITRLNNRRNEIPTNVNHLSGNGVATELSNYIARHK